MNFKTYLLLPLLLLMAAATTLHAQCIDWLAPSPTSGWIDFNTEFGGAPCDDGMGCPFNEIQDFEVFAAEAYSVNGFIAGGEYAFSMCNGPGAGTWVPEFTIIAPSGVIDAFGAGDGDACTITWTASEDGTYLIVINEADNCGGGPNTGTANGFPALTCISGAVCEPVDVTCNAGTLTTSGETTVCGDEATFDLAVEMDTIPDGGSFVYTFGDDLGGTGGLAGGFTLTGVTTMETYNSDLSGILSGNMLPALEGPWVIRAAVRDANDMTCSTSADSLIVNFGPLVVVDGIVDNGDGSATVTASGGTAPLAYEWSDGQTTATATGLMDGDYTVTITDAIGCTEEAMVTVMVSAVDNIESLEALTISPNPTTDGRFLVDVQLNATRNLEVSILDVTGRAITQQKRQTSGERLSFDLSSQAAGIYLVRIQVGQESLYRRVVLTK